MSTQSTVVAQLLPATGDHARHSDVVSISVLPVEVVSQILSHVTGRADRATAAAVCREWYRELIVRIWHTIEPIAISELCSIAINVAMRPGNSVLLNFDSNGGGGSSHLLRFVKEINLTSIRYYDAEPSAPLGRILFHTYNLRSVVFDNCMWITDALLAPLVNCTELRLLSLHGCPQVTPAAIPPAAFPHLEKLYLNYCEGMTDLAPTIAELATTRLKGVSVPGTILRNPNLVLQTLLRRFAETLEYIDMGWNVSSLDDRAFLQSPPLPNLTHLKLEFCGSITETALAKLVAPQLQELAITGVHEVNEEAVTALLASKPNLTLLDMSMRKISSDDQLLRILGLLCNSEPTVQLEWLFLNNVLTLTDKFIYRIARMKSLKNLFINNNLKITQTAVDWLREQLPGMLQLQVGPDAVENAGSETSSGSY